MKKIAVIAPCILPVPASKGGAVEELVTCIINQNEISKHYSIDLFTIEDSSYSLTSFSCTNIFSVSLDNRTHKLDKVTDKLYRTIGSKEGAKRSFDQKIISEFIKREASLDEDYYAVIVENQMSLAVELLKATEFQRDYPIYFHMHNDVDIYRSPNYIKFLAKNGVQFIAISKYIESQILRYANDAKVSLLYNGVSLDAYSMTTKKCEENIKFLYAGRVIPVKGVEQLVDGFIMLLDKLPVEYKYRVSLDVIGFSDNLSRYEQRIYEKAEKYPDIIKCQKRIPTAKMAEAYNNYDVVVMPTVNEEPFGLVALETIAKGMPLITTNSGAIPEVVGEGAVIVDKSHNLAAGLCSAMMELATNPDYRQELGKKAFSLARRNVEFDIDSYYDRLVGILNMDYSEEMISVVVPVYNVEEKLGVCVDSLVNQTYKNLEIILVDDGSTDNSGQLCEEHAKTDARIKVVHQKNQGLSGARNTGIDNATGKYIFFLDSDDYLTYDALEKLLDQLHRCNADVAACGFAHVYDGDKPEMRFTNPNPGMWSGRESVIQMMRNNNICSVAWNKLYKAELWDGIRFPVGRLHEDEATTYKILYRAKLVTYIPECLHKYYQRDNSIMNAGLEHRYGDFFQAIKERISYFTEKNDMELVENARVTYLDYIKYIYRNVDQQELRRRLVNEYSEEIRKNHAPSVCGPRKKFGLYLWRYFHY